MELVTAMEELGETAPFGRTVPHTVEMLPGAMGESAMPDGQRHAGAPAMPSAAVDATAGSS
ncbi:hypothetical protein [Arthrobacter cavernae]|uniref:Uncharacterized protein n=1 Tax=Arthrobacter cavernae TaxID=2817681 RepID=A0A939HJ50_9MICC|nr:hypothetical protein [Arthrobacter cavernae]MBO1268370.1 hypothetical protein [Arthrobacter cavernae]